MESGMSVVFDTKSEIPVAPPSMNRLVMRNPLNPNVAEKMPMVIKTPSFSTRMVAFCLLKMLDFACLPLV
jgi:hypothetical protein